MGYVPVLLYLLIRLELCVSVCSFAVSYLSGISRWVFSYLEAGCSWGSVVVWQCCGWRVGGVVVWQCCGYW